MGRMLGRCKASGCERRTPPAMHFCSDHWGKLTNDQRAALGFHLKRAEEARVVEVSDYRPFMAALHECQHWLARREGRDHAERYHERMAEMYRLEVPK